MMGSLWRLVPGLVSVGLFGIGVRELLTVDSMHSFAGFLGLFMLLVGAILVFDRVVAPCLSYVQDQEVLR